MSGENNKTTEKKPEDKVKESIVTIKEYMEEHNLKSPAFTGHNNVFWRELECYMKLKIVE